MNLDTVITFFSSYKHCAKNLFLKSSSEKSFVLVNVMKFFKQGQHVLFSISFIPNMERNQCADWIFSYQVRTLKDKIIGGLKHIFFLKVALKFCLQIYWMYMYTSTHFFPNTADLRSHWIKSRLNCCSAPMETCLTLLSIRKFIREVATCLHADMQEVLATFSCKTIRFTLELYIKYYVQVSQIVVNSIYIIIMYCL